MDGAYLTIKNTSEGLFKAKGSKFFAYAHKVKSQDEVKSIVKDYKKKYYDARHHCYGVVLGENGEFQQGGDDGEPSGTAGAPIVGKIRSKGLTNVVIIVVRYFGGTKLGVPGLIEAYGGASDNALVNAKVVEEFVMQEIEVNVSYEALDKVMRAIKTHDLNIVNQSFTDNVKMKLAVKKQQYIDVKRQLKDFLN